MSRSTTATTAAGAAVAGALVAHYSRRHTQALATERAKRLTEQLAFREQQKLAAARARCDQEVRARWDARVQSALEHYGATQDVVAAAEQIVDEALAAYTREER